MSSDKTVVTPPSPRIRGDVHVIVGRGESAGVYDRFAGRISADGYRVTVGNDDEIDLASVEYGQRPQVLVGVDAGALRALAFVAEHPGAVAGLVLVGVPGPDDPIPRDWSAEVEGRASCPTQQGKLRDGGIVTPGHLVPEELPEAEDEVIVDVPVLALHGADDPISPLSLATTRYAAVGATPLVVVDGGRHDVLNSVHHRSVAARVIQFLESLRVDEESRPHILREVAV